MARISTTIAREVRRLRLERGMSAQRLSDACTELGAPIPRTVLSNLENGRRGNVTVAELFVLAKALSVPPATLVFPVGLEASVEVLPGTEVSSEAAVDWVAGRFLLPGDAANINDPNVSLHRYRRFSMMLKKLEEQVAIWGLNNRYEQEVREQRDATRNEQMLYQHELQDAKQEQARVANMAVDARARGETEEGHRLAERLSDASRRAMVAERQLHIAHEKLQRAEMERAMIVAERDKIGSMVEEIRADMNDMERRGWILPRIPEAIREFMDGRYPLRAANQKGE